MALWGRDQVDRVYRVENPWAHPPYGHTKVKATYRATTYENDLKISRKDFPRLKIYKRNHNEVGKSDKDGLPVKRPASDWLKSGKDATTTEVLPQEQGERAPHQPEYLATGRRAPRKWDFESHRGLHLEEIEIYRK